MAHYTALANDFRLPFPSSMYRLSSMAKVKPLPIMEKVLALFEKSGKSLDELGLAMGYPKASARKSAWLFLRRTTDPRLSMLERFAMAMGMDVKELL
jgi:hypothetical protein